MGADGAGTETGRVQLMARRQGTPITDVILIALCLTVYGVVEAWRRLGRAVRV